MKTTFFHDTTFIYDENKYYTCGAMNREKFEYYKKEFGKITAVVKVIQCNDKNKEAVQTKNLVDNISVCGVSRNYKNSIEVVKKQMENTDFAIIRMPSIIGTVACKEARKKKVPYLIEMVGCPREALWYHGGLKYKLLMPFIVFINKLELKRSKFTIYVTKKFLQKKYPTEGNYIDCSDVELEEDNEEVLSKRIEKINKLDSTKDIIKIGLIGSLDVNYKGHLTAIKALESLKKSFNIQLYVIGRGNKEKWLNIARQKKVKENIIFVGTIPHIEMKKWYDNMDIFIMPSLTEGMPRALIEAMSRGCPCVGTAVGGIPELLNKEVLINRKNHKQLEKKIRNFLNNKEYMTKCSKRNIEVTKEYRKQVLDEKRKKYYEYVLKEVNNDKSITSSK